MGGEEVKVNHSQVNSAIFWQGYYDGYDGFDPDPKYPEHDQRIETTIYWNGYREGIFDVLTAEERKEPAR